MADRLEISDALISKREKRWRRTLPLSFKSFIKQYCGFTPDKRIEIAENIFLEKVLCIVPKISDSPMGEYDIETVFTKYDAYLVFSPDSVGMDLIPYAMLNGEKLLCLCYKKEQPSVVVWSFVGSKKYEPNYSQVFESFDDFITAFQQQIN